MNVFKMKFLILFVENPKKNQTDKLIIIYHIDERNGIPVATKFAEKGFENVFLLSGGM